MQSRGIGSVVCGVLICFCMVEALPAGDYLRDLQERAVVSGQAPWGHWGPDPQKYNNWTSHSNRLIPVYSFGMNMESVRGENSVYRDASRLAALYGRLPDATLNPNAEYFDQTDVYHLQMQAAKAGKKNIILVVFDGMDWPTTQAAAIYQAGRVGYREGRGTGLHFLDYRGVETDFGYFVTSPHNDGTKFDVNVQAVNNPGGELPGGYDFQLAGETPWGAPIDPLYPIAKSTQRKQAYTDSASSATSLCAGIKTYNDAVNVDPQGRRVPTVAHQLQSQGYSIGVVTSVPISHATPASAYSNNVSRDDYQDLTRDLLGLSSVANRKPLPGVDVLIGCGIGEVALLEGGQGDNFVIGNKYLTTDDLRKIDASQSETGRYHVVQRAKGVPGASALAAAAQVAIQQKQRLFGYYGASLGHLPFRTADGNFNPTVGANRIQQDYSPRDMEENPTLAEMAQAALAVLSQNPKGFWLMVEAGDVDWANHDNNLDASIGAVVSGDLAFKAVCDWVEQHQAWDDTVVLLTADHGHYLVLEDPTALLPPTTSAAK